MPNKWVDNSDYFGPDRRRRSAGKRWSDRRHHDETGDLPPLGALLRRLRVQMLGLASPEDRRHALQLLNGAIGEASRQGMLECAGALQAADRALREYGAAAASQIDAKIVEAMDHASAGR